MIPSGYNSADEFQWSSANSDINTACNISKVEIMTISDTGLGWKQLFYFLNQSCHKQSGIMMITPHNRHDKKQHSFYFFYWLNSILLLIRGQLTKFPKFIVCESINKCKRLLQTVSKSVLLFLLGIYCEKTITWKTETS